MPAIELPPSPTRTGARIRPVPLARRQLRAGHARGSASGVIEACAHGIRTREHQAQQRQQAKERYSPWCQPPSSAPASPARRSRPRPQPKTSSAWPRTTWTIDPTRHHRADQTTPSRPTSGQPDCRAAELEPEEGDCSSGRAAAPTTPREVYRGPPHQQTPACGDLFHPRAPARHTGPAGCRDAAPPPAEPGWAARLWVTRRDWLALAPTEAPHAHPDMAAQQAAPTRRRIGKVRIASASAAPASAQSAS